MNLPKNILFACLAVLGVAAALISGIAISTRAADVNKLTRTHVLSNIDGRLESAFATINAFPGSAGKDLLFLKTLARAEDLYTFISNNNAYKELLLFDDEGACTMKIERGRSNERSCGMLPDGVRDVTEKTKALSTGGVHISPLVLHDGVPALLYATSHDEGGMIVSVIDADYFLEDIRRLTRDGESVYLLLRDGSYLAHPDKAHERLVGGEANFYRDFTGVPGGTLDDTDVRRFETESHIFTFWRIFPSASNFALYEGVSALYGKAYADEHYWVMAAVSEKSQSGNWWQEPSYLVVISLIAVLNLFLIALAYLIVRRESHNTL